MLLFPQQCSWHYQINGSGEQLTLQVHPTGLGKIHDQKI